MVAVWLYEFTPVTNHHNNKGYTLRPGTCRASLVSPVAPDLAKLPLLSLIMYS